MNPLDQMRSLFTVSRYRRNESRFAFYGHFDAHTGDLLEVFASRSAAEASKTKADHRLRVRGVPADQVSKALQKQLKKAEKRRAGVS